MVPLFWGGFLINSSAERAHTLEHAKARGAGVAQIFQENTERTLLGIDRSLRLLRMLWEKDPDNFDIKSWADNAALVAGVTAQIGLIGPDGFTGPTTRDYKGPPIYVGDREHFIKGKTLDHDALYISKPVVGRLSGQVVVHLLRRLQRPDGSFGGLIMASIDPERIGEFFANAQLGKGGTLILRNSDYVILSARGLERSVIGQQANTGRLAAAIAKSRDGFYWGKGGVDGVNRLVSYRTSDALPLSFTVGTSEEAIFGDYWHHQRQLLATLSLFTIGLCIAAFLDIRRRLKLEQIQIDLKDMALRFRSATENMSQGLIMFDKDDRLVAYNTRYLEMYGISAGTLRLGSSVTEVLEQRRAAGNFDCEPDTLIRDLKARIAEGERLQTVFNLPDGRAISVIACPKDEGGWVATHYDITDRQRAEDELAKMKNFLDTVVQNIPIPIAIRDTETRKFILVNRAYETFLGMERQQILGKTLADLYSEDIVTSAQAYDDQAVAAVDSIVTNEFPVDTKANGRRMVTTTRIAVRDRAGRPQYIIAIVDDITERKSSEAKIAQLAHYDTLTDLANRNLFRERINDCLDLLAQQQTQFAVFLLDLDRFKGVNDAYGHQTGDVLLREVARRIKGEIREVDVAARLGGDEFALIVQPGGSSAEDACTGLASRLIEAIGRPFEIDGQTIAVGCSIGIALAPEHGDKSDELLKNADLALYKSKETGRHCFHVYREELKAEADRRDALENDLRTAIWREEFELFYQPIVDVKTGRTRAVEALMRWRHPTKGLIAPNSFIPLAEETGLIVQLGSWAMTRACLDATRMPADVTVSVNLSPVQFSKSSVVDAVILALVESQLPPERLELEITENVLLKETENNLEVLRQIKNLGVSIALDDFGVGYSSLGYLTSFPFDKVKIDRSFVEKLDRTESKAVISSIVQLSHSLHLTTTAEGIETAGQLAEIKALGIELCQGYLFSRPVPLAELDLAAVRPFPTAETQAA